MNFGKLFGAGFLLSAVALGCGGDDAAVGSGDSGTSTGSAGAQASGGGGGSSGASVGASGGPSGSGGGISGTGGATSGPGGAGVDGSTPDVSGGGAAGSAGGSGTGGSAGSGQDSSVSTDGGGSDGNVSCGVFNDPCSSGATCCSGTCDPRSHTCGSTVVKCSNQGTPCTAPTDCCSLNCGANGFCAAQCTSDGQSCSNDGGGGSCCSANCNGTTCIPLNTTCRTAGNACSTDDQCCSHLCKGGSCSLGGSYCIQTGDACVRGGDCCGGICNIAAGATLGTCDVPNPGGTRCSGAVDGTVCNGCGTCCSRLCAPYALTGVFICQPANGCHIDGDLCVRDQDCCGNDNSLPTSGKNVQCVRDNPSDPVGLCRNPMGCSPEGNVCHYRQDPNYSCNVSSAPNNCCGATGNSGACQLDALGVPRCHGIPVCRAPGETCAYSGDCCNGVPCVPDDTGQLRCLIVPDGGRICVPTNGNCTVTADCCPGNECVVPQGSTLGKCGPLQPPPSDGGTPPPNDAATDGGSAPPDGGTPPPDDSGTTPDGSAPPPDGPPPPPVCSQYGQLCTVDSDCCNAIPCTGGICRIPPM